MIHNLRILSLGICALLAICSSASAALIVQSLAYDGHVRIGGSTGVEEHFLGTPFPPPNANISLPATNSLAAPFASPNNLIMSADLQPLAPLNGEIYPKLELWIRNTNPADGFEVFDNPLDANLQYPVQLELFLYLEELAANEQLVVHHRYEAYDGILPFAPFGEIAPPSGRGSQADPLRLQLGLPATAVNVDFTNGWLKTHLYYETDTDIIPEPASWMLSLVGLAVVAALRRRS